MKRLVFSVLAGCAATALVYWLCHIPTHGPTLMFWVVWPFAALTELIKKNGSYEFIRLIVNNWVLDECVFYGLQVLVFSGASYVAIGVFKWLRVPVGDQK